MKVKELRKKLLRSLRNLRLKNGLYYASSAHIYNYVWIRDCFYESLPELVECPENYKQTYQTLLDYFLEMESRYKKISSLIEDPDLPHGKEWRFLHIRFNPDLTEVRSPWGHVQLDAITMCLAGIYNGESNGIKIIRDDRDRAVIQLIIDMLEAIKYWELEDNSIWEEDRQVHLNSITIATYSLSAIRLLGFRVSQDGLDKAHETINRLAPNESVTKNVDLSLLFLVYPFNLTPVSIAKQIIANIEAELLRPNGVIRYKKDRYFMEDGIESPWTFGISGLAMAYYTIGDIEKAKYYARLVIERTIIEEDKIPEMFLGDSDEPNPNKDLGWSLSMGYICLELIDDEEVELLPNGRYIMKRL